MNPHLSAAPLLLALAFSVQANASLIPLAGGAMLYDDDRNITWLANANYAKTSNFSFDGYMSWQLANDWAQNLVYGGYDDWRLPNVVVPDATCSSNPINSTHAIGPNCRSSELGHLYLDEFMTSHGSYWNLVDNLIVSSVVLPETFWTANASTLPGNAYAFDWKYGTQFIQNEEYKARAWAVRDGDVADNSVPEPGSLFLVGAGLGMMAVFCLLTRLGGNQFIRMNHDY